MKVSPASLILRISLVIAVVSGLLAGGLNYFQVRNKIERLRAELAAQTTIAQKAEGELARSQGDLEKALVNLKVTKTELDQTVAEKQAVTATATEQTVLARKRGEELATLRPQLEDAQRYLARYHVAGLEPEQIMGAAREIKNLRDSLARVEKINLGLNTKVRALSAAGQSDAAFPVPLPPGLQAKVISTDATWRFLVLDVGATQGALENGEVLVRHGDKLVGKARISRVEPDRCVANLLTGWDLGDVKKGDVAIPATPQS